MATAKRVVITGGGGFVGTYLSRELQRAGGYDVFVWDKDEPGNAEGVQFSFVDILREDTYIEQLREVRPDWIVHLAAISSVSFSWDNPELTRRVNAEATASLLSCVRKHSPDTHVFIVSSSDIYGKVPPTPLPELSLRQAHPQNPYARSKWEMEQIVEESFNDMCIRVRPFPHIGPGQKKGFVTADFASQIASIEAGRQEPVMRIGNVAAKRDFTDVRDVARAYRLLLEQGSVGEVYHVASGKATAIADVLDILLSFSEDTISVQENPDLLRPSDNPCIVGSAAKVRELSGWQPSIPLRQSLLDVLTYWRNENS